MQKLLTPILILGLTGAVAKSKERVYQIGTIVSMNSVPCGTQQKGHKKTEELLCHEYILRSGNIDYHVRQKQGKVADLLPVGVQAEFRIDKDRMYLRAPVGEGKERQLLVVSEKANSAAPVPNSPPQQ